MDHQCELIHSSGHTFIKLSKFDKYIDLDKILILFLSENKIYINDLYYIEFEDKETAKQIHDEIVNILLA